MKYRIKHITYMPLDVDSEEQREFDEAFSELVQDALSVIVAPNDLIERVNASLDQM